MQISWQFCLATVKVSEKLAAARSGASARLKRLLRRIKARDLRKRKRQETRGIYIQTNFKAPFESFRGFLRRAEKMEPAEPTAPAV